MKAPIEPNKEDCCNSGCNPCIFEVYDKQLKLYEKFLKDGVAEKYSTENAISELECTQFILIKSTVVCDSHLQLFFKRLHEDKLRVWWKDGDHLLLKFVSEHHTCTRAYTPLKLDEDVDTHDFSIIIKVYKNGLVSNYLKTLKPGSSTLWRGPYGSYEYVTNQYDRIIMIVQGTGIVAVINIIHKILNNEDELTKTVLYYCCKNEDVILFRDKLYNFNSFWNFTYKIFLSSVSSKCLKYQEPIVEKKLCKDDILSLNAVKSKDQILLCGSSEFMKCYETCIKDVSSELNVLLF